ncbi:MULTISPECIES: hypothetical protein [unclassified Microcystis]|uniref:hypothetical protein n=1 Tax=unclassified Microcystis TaxID=2643300 RepID=UPI003390272B
MSYATYRIIRNETLIEKDIWRFLSIVFDLERTNQLNLLPDKDLVDLCPPIEPYQVTKNLIFFILPSPCSPPRQLIIDN